MQLIASGEVMDSISLVANTPGNLSRPAALKSPQPPPSRKSIVDATGAALMKRLSSLLDYMLL
jgi:hypothetical protein